MAAGYFGGQSVYGQLPPTGALSPAASGALGASSHIDDEPSRAVPGSTPIWGTGISPAWTTLLFLAVAFLIWRVALR